MGISSEFVKLHVKLHMALLNTLLALTGDTGSDAST